jgi:hypothetical protein
LLGTKELANAINLTADVQQSQLADVSILLDYLVVAVEIAVKVSGCGLMCVCLHSKNEVHTRQKGNLKVTAVNFKVEHKQSESECTITEIAFRTQNVM